VFDKVTQHVKSLRGEHHTIFAAPQAVVNDVEPEGMKLLHLLGQFRGRSAFESLRH